MFHRMCANIARWLMCSPHFVAGVYMDSMADIVEILMIVYAITSS